MYRRVVCLLCAAAIIVCMCVGASAESTIPVGAAGPSAQSTRAKTAKMTAPLVSAMILVLAGMGVSMLFENRDP